MNLIWTLLTDSTNTQITNYPANTILLANSQTAGRGRYGNQWLSGNGGIYFSYKIKTPLTELKTTFWSIAVGIATHKAFNNLHIKTLIKWPNDIYNFQGQKLAGILLERALGKTNELIIGIGINYQNYNLAADFAYLEIKANKLSIINLIIQNINQVFNSSFLNLKKYYQEFAYIQDNSYINYLKLDQGEQIYTCLVKDLLENGELLVQEIDNNDGKVGSYQSLNASEIKKVRRFLT